MESVVKTAREAVGLTQEELAKEAKLSQGYISQIERGERIPSIKTLLKISAALGVSPVSLLPGKAQAS